MSNNKKKGGETMTTYTRGQKLGNGVCSVCRKRFEHTFVVTIENKTKAIKRRWCNECFEQTKLIADHSADMSR